MHQRRIKTRVDTSGACARLSKKSDSDFSRRASGGAGAPRSERTVREKKRRASTALRAAASYPHKGRVRVWHREIVQCVAHAVASALEHVMAVTFAHAQSCLTSRTPEGWARYRAASYLRSPYGQQQITVGVWNHRIRNDGRLRVDSHRGRSRRAGCLPCERARRALRNANGYQPQSARRRQSILRSVGQACDVSSIDRNECPRLVAETGRSD